MILQYAPADSVLHRMDPLSKFVWIFVIGVLGFILSAPELVAILLLTVLLVAVTLGGISLGRLLIAGKYYWILGLAAGTFQLFIRHSGDVLASLGPLEITTEGLRFGATFALRISLIAFASLVFIWTTDPKRLVMGLIYLGLPYRIAYSVFIALRFVPVLEHEAVVIREAQAVRGVDEVKGRLEGLKRYVIPLLVSALRKSQAMAVAMEARCFGVGKTRTYLEEFSWTGSGFALIVGFMALGGVLVWIALQTGGAFAR
jgi:energy-coupling factor transport system permease protein